MNDKVTTNGEPDMALEKQQIARADSVAFDFDANRDLIFRVSRNIDTESTQHGSDQAAAIKSRGADTAPQIWNAEESLSLSDDLRTCRVRPANRNHRLKVAST